MQQISNMHVTVSNTDLWLSCNRSVCDRSVTALLFVYGVALMIMNMKTVALTIMNTIIYHNIGFIQYDNYKQWGMNLLSIVHGLEYGLPCCSFGASSHE